MNKTHLLKYWEENGPKYYCGSNGTSWSWQIDKVTCISCTRAYFRLTAI